MTGAVFVFGAPYGRRKTHGQVHQNRTKNTPVLSDAPGKALSRRDKTATKVRQKTAACTLSQWDKTGTKVRQKHGFSAVSACQNRDKSATEIQRCALSRRGKTVAKVGQVKRRFLRRRLSAGKRPFPGHPHKTPLSVGDTGGGARASHAGGLPARRRCSRCS